ncbi:MAG: hypothetical protein IPN21_18230 [Burkholderiales bacterium]|nr:hypothetical protein [Burkholderiales bacterium]
MRMYSDAQSYEDWMNDMATMERSSPKGWHAKYQPRCDRCGRFVLPGSPGSSWVHVPDSHVSVGDDRERCAACTKKHGPAQAMPGYVTHLVQGVVPDA